MAPIVTPTSVTLKAVGLSLNQEVKFSLRSNSTLTPDYFETVNTQNSDASGAGSAKASFTGLVPEGQYVANIADANTGSVLAIKGFATPKAGSVSPADPTQTNIVAPVVTLSTKDITSTSAMIDITIEKVDARSFPIEMGIFYAKDGINADVVPLDTKSLTINDLPYSTSVSLTGIDSGATYSYKGTVKSGTSSWSTNVFTFKTLEAPVVPPAPKVELNTEGVRLSPSEIKSTEVTLNAIELTPKVGAVFTLENDTKSSSTPAYSKTQKFTSDETGAGTALFTGLSPKGKYVATLNYEGENTMIGTISIETTSGKSSDNVITSFEFAGIAKGKINGTAVAVMVPPKTDIKALSPVIGLPTLATVTPDEDLVQDFTDPVKYTVIAEDGSKKEYTVSVTIAKDFYELANNGKDISGTTTENTYKDTSNHAPIDDGAKGIVTCTTNCGWNELLAMVARFINYIIFLLAMPLAAIMFAYAGFQLITSGGSSEKKSKAKEIFINVAMGFVFAVAAWLIIHTISTILGYNGSWIGL